MTSIAHANICNLDPLYTSDFTFSLPKAVLESYFDGKAFDNKTSYTDEERMLLEWDINAIWDRMVLQRSATPTAVITAGAPGAGKTTLMERVMKENIPYIDPDAVCLKKMDLTYGAGIKALSTMKFNSPAAELSARLDLYSKWRPGSNAANHVILANLIRKNSDFYFGTTATSPGAANLFKLLKERGYRIKLLHITAPDDVRWASIRERDKTFVQTTQEDVKEKGLLLPQRIQDTYLKFADEIEFFYRGAVNENGTLAATWTKEEGLAIQDVAVYGQIKKVHNAICDLLKRPELYWEKTVEMR